MPQNNPMKDLRNANMISDRCHAKMEPVFVTKNGYGDLVVMSMGKNEAMDSTAVIDNARLYKKPVRYFTYASASKCAEQLAKADC